MCGKFEIQNNTKIQMAPVWVMLNINYCGGDTVV